MRLNMGEGRIHRNDRIEENLEIRRGIAFAVRSNDACEMSASRTAHYSYVFSIDIPCFSIASEQFHGILSISDRHSAVAFWHTIFQHSHGDAEVIEEWRPVFSLMSRGKNLVRSARKNQYRPSSSLLLRRLIDGDFGGIAIIVRRFGIAIERQNGRILRHRK